MYPWYLFPTLYVPCLFDAFINTIVVLSSQFYCSHNEIKIFLHNLTRSMFFFLKGTRGKDSSNFNHEDWGMNAPHFHHWYGCRECLIISIYPSPSVFWTLVLKEYFSLFLGAGIFTMGQKFTKMLLLSIHCYFFLHLRSTGVGWTTSWRTSL